MRKLLFLTIVGLFTFNAFAQQKDPSAVGEVRGLVRDSAHNYSLQSATIAIYSKKDSSLVVYQLANTLGEFSAKNIPIGTPLYADFTFLGYKGERKYFTINTNDKIFDFKTINLSKQEIELKEVVVKPPPIRMNRDTVEFFADAYTMEKSATVEDFIRKLVGLTVWGDGSITYNGKPINTLTVNGKPFFGEDLKVATQNLPKNVVEKIQVFNTAKKENPLDSIIRMNVKLKKGMDKGIFGKIGAGYGTDKRYGADASLKYFNEKIQVAALGASNNTNRSANSISSLQQYSAFQGQGTNTDYNSNFRRIGLNKQYAGGAQFQYAFLKKKSNIDEQNLLSGDYFLSKNFNDTESNNIIDRVVPSATDTRRTDISLRNGINTNQSFNLKYRVNSRKSTFVLTPKVNRSFYDNVSSANSSVAFQSGTKQSTSSAQNVSTGSNDFYQISGSYNLTSTGASNFKRLMPTFYAEFDLNNSSNNNERINVTQFQSLTDATNNTSYNRKYHNNSSNNNQKITVSSMPLQYLLFGKQYRKGVPTFKLKNKLALNQTQNIDLVSDFNAAQNTYLANKYLTNTSRYNLSDDILGLNLNRAFDLGSLEGRYRKTLSVNLDLQNQFLNQHNNSDKEFQNINRNYHSFIPQATFNFTNYQNGSHNNSVDLIYSTSVNIPEIYQLAPLVDSTDVYNFNQGNLNLKKAYIHNLHFNFNHFPNGIKKGINYGFSVNYVPVSNFMADSISYDEQGRRTISYANVKGYRQFSANGSLNKSIKFDNHQFQLRLNMGYTFLRSPNYINRLANTVETNSVTTNIILGYSFREKVFLNLTQSINNSSSKNGSGLGLAKYSNFSSTTSPSLSMPVFKGLTMATNLNFQTNKPSTSNAINYTIWNANLIQRFTEEKNIELRLDALDLLRQNKSIRIFNDGTTLTNSQTNMLTQYFIVSLSYFPRKFGANKK